MAPSFAGLVALVLVGLCGHSANGEAPLFEYGDANGDSGVTGVIPLTFNISFLGFNYSSLYVSFDGTVGFVKEVKYEPSVHYSEGLKSSSFDLPFIAPLYYNGYLNPNIEPKDYQGKLWYRVVDYDKPADPASSHFTQQQQDLRNYLNQYLPSAVVSIPHNLSITFLVVITWENVAEAPNTQSCEKSTPCNGTTFQLALAGDRTHTFAIFNYGKYDISVQTNYQAGFNGGYRRGWYNVLPCYSGCRQILQDSAISNLHSFQGSDIKGRYIFSVGQVNVIRGGCLSEEIDNRILEVYPRTVGMFGGEKLEVSGLCGAINATIYCRFGSAADQHSPVVAGTMVSPMKGYCSVPLLATTGRLSVYWSNDSKIWNADQSINVVLPSRLGDPVDVDRPVKEKWYQRDATEITVKWNPNKFTTAHQVNVDVKLIGYREHEKEVEYKELANFGSTQNSQGWLTFNVEQHRCRQDCEAFEFGLLEVSLPQQYHGLATHRVAQRFGPIPLGWYVNQELVATRGSDWSNEKCKQWHEVDSRYEGWVNDLLPCPCNLDQALADFGRWQADPGCNLFTGSQCYYHQGAKHCVRSVVPTARDGAGNQCCYNSDGSLVYSQLSNQGSTPDRSHVWGARPYNRPDRVPELSHWKHDVISFYYCCLWNNYELCDLYMEQRPTTDCRNYDSPGLGLVGGLTHITTFDGNTYHFPGSGDFFLVNYKPISLIIQGKFELHAQSWDLGSLTNRGSWQARALTALAMSSGHSKIEVNLAPETSPQKHGLDIKVDEELIHLNHKVSFWRDFEDFSVVNNARDVSDNNHNNFTFLLTKFSVGVSVVSVNNLLYVTVAVPPSYKPGHAGQRPNLEGLLGAYDGLADNDFLTRQGKVVPLTANKTFIFQEFILPWKVESDDYKIFKFPTSAQELDPQHSYFEYNQLPRNFRGAPDETYVNGVCWTNEKCKWDLRISGKSNIAEATKNADAWFENLKRLSRRVDSCGLPEVGRRPTLNTNNFSAGSEVLVTACEQGQSLSEPVPISCVREYLDDAEKNGRADYGVRWTDTANSNTYIVHWVPRGDTVCSDGTDSSSNLGLIIGVVVGAIVVIIIIIVVIVVILRKRKSGKASTTVERTERTPKKRSGKDKKTVETDPVAAEAMLTRVEDRSPVYKPGKESVRMSEVEGSNV